MDIVRVLRVIEYVGPRDLVEEELSKSLQGERRFGPNREGVIRAATLGTYPEVLSQGPQSDRYPGEVLEELEESPSYVLRDKKQAEQDHFNA